MKAKSKLKKAPSQRRVSRNPFGVITNLRQSLRLWQRIGGLAGLIAMLGLVVAVLAWQNDITSGEGQDVAQATLISIQTFDYRT